MLIFIDGFDHYATADLSKKWTSVVGAGATIVAGSGRRGGGAFGNATVSAAFNVSKAIPATTSFVIGFAFFYGTFPVASRVICQLLDAGTAQCSLLFNVDGTLSVVRSTGTALTNGTSVAVLSGSTYYYIEWKVTISDSISANSCKVRVNGVDVITVATSQDTKATANSTANSVLIGSSSSFGSDDVYFDDFYICDQSGSTNNDFLGDVRIDTIYPTSDGNYSQFTPSTGTTHYTLVDETAPNTSDYNDGAAVNDRDSYGMGNLASIAAQTVYAVQVNAAINKDDAGSKSAATFVRSSSTNGDGASTALGTTQAYVSQVFETNPNGSIAWTETTVNAMEAGVLVTA